MDNFAKFLILEFLIMIEKNSQMVETDSWKLEATNCFDRVILVT